jgi:transglutaminase-like putative cysteine protease
LRLPVPLPDGAVGEVRAGFLPDEGVETEIKTAPARVEILARVPECGRITVGVEAIFTTAAGAPAASDATLDAADRELYTRPSEGLIRVSDRIRSLAAELAGAETDSLAAARRFWIFMMEELACSPMHYDRLDPDHPLDHVLDSGWYDCLVGSALMAALCRARAIPARLVSGYMLHVTAPGFHTWLEVWIAGQGWLPFDLTCWSWSLGGRDAHWRDLYFGQLNQRVAVARPPRLFNSVGAVRLPSAWHLLSRIEGKGSVIEFRTIDTDALIYSDHMELEHLG